MVALLAREVSLVERPPIQAVGGGSIPTSGLRVYVISWEVGRQFIRTHHYMHNAPPLGRVAYGVFVDDSPLSRMIGALLFGRPAARGEDQINTLEIRRMFIADVTAKNAESRCIAAALRDIRRRCPEIRRIIAYADPSAGHVGTIYKASGFTCIGISKGDPKKQGQRAFYNNVISPSDKFKYELILKATA